MTHPVVLGGMGLGTNPDLVAAVSNAGGLGIQGCGGRPPDKITQLAAAIRERIDRPFGLNLLLFNSTVWPGAYARIERNRFYERWAGREGEPRYRHAEAAASAWRALEAGDTDNAFLCTGQTAGLIDAIEPARVVVQRIITEAIEWLRGTKFAG